jgi:hypothetical protein
MGFMRAVPAASTSSTHAVDLLQVPLAPMPTSASQFDHAACFGGSGIVSMREVIAEGTCIPHFRSSVSAEGSAHPRIDGSRVAPEHISTDLLALAASSSSSELSATPPARPLSSTAAIAVSVEAGHT